MQKSFSTQPELFVSARDLEHPILHSLDQTEALLEWFEIETLLSSIYAAKTGRPSFPLQDPVSKLTVRYMVSIIRCTAGAILIS